MPGRLIVILLLILAIEVTAAAGDFKKDAPGSVCGYLAQEGLKTEGYKKLDGDEYFACSPYKTIGTGSSPSNLAYYIEGSQSTVAKVYLTLNINNPADGTKGRDQLLSAGKTLAEKATGKPLPKEPHQAIENGRTGRWKVGSSTIKVIKENFPSGKGYSITLQFE